MGKKKKSKRKDNEGKFHSTLADKLSKVKVKTKTQSKRERQSNGPPLGALREPPASYGAPATDEGHDSALLEAFSKDEGPAEPSPQPSPASQDDLLAAQQRHKAQLQRLESQLDGLRQELRKSQQEHRGALALHEAECQRSERFLQEREGLKQELQQLSGATQSVEALLAVRGVPGPSRDEAFGQLAQRFTAQMLPLLSADAIGFKELLDHHLVLSCAHPDCQEELRCTSKLLLLVQEADCENCKGSENRRLFNRMVRTCRENRRYRMVIVGGSPDAHKEIQRLIPDGFVQRIVSGKERRTKQQATEDLRYADLVVIWGPTILPHKISELYTRQKEYADKIAFVTRRGVGSFAKEVIEFFD